MLSTRRGLVSSRCGQLLARPQRSGGVAKRRRPARKWLLGLRIYYVRGVGGASSGEVQSRRRHVTRWSVGGGSVHCFCSIPGIAGRVEISGALIVEPYVAQNPVVLR
jgi:hypothetical protein